MDIFGSLATFIFWLFLVYLAWLLAAGPKLTVLYLRKFGSSSAQIAVTTAIERGLSRRYRIITLDDASFPAIEVPRLYKRVSRYAAPLILLAFVTAVTLTISWLANAYAPTITNFIYGPILAGFMEFLAPTLLALPGIIMAAGIGLLLNRRMVRRRAKLTIRVPEEIDKAEFAVIDLTSWSRRSVFLAPRATVIEVTNALWRTAVTRLFASTNIVLVDVSVDTESLQWELSLLASQSFRQTVFIANRTSSNIATIPPDSRCLRYDESASKADQKEFATSLLELFDTRANGPPPFSIWECAVRPVIAFFRALLLFAALVCIIWLAQLLVPTQQLGL